MFSVLDLKHAFYCINLDEESIQYTSCCASQGSPVYQFRKLAQGLKSSPAFFTSLMNGILSELPDDIREHLECIMDDVVIYTSDIDMDMKVIKAFMYKLKDHGLLLTINKVHSFHKDVKYMGLRMSSSEGRPTITPLGSRVKAIATLPITARGIKSFVGCILYLVQFLPHLSKLVKPINDILKKSNKLQKLNKISPLPPCAKGKRVDKRKSPDIQKFWTAEHINNFELIKKVIVKSSVLFLPDRTGEFVLECDFSAKFVGSVLYQVQNGEKRVIAFFSAVMPDAACRYSRSEIELCSVKKLMIHFQYLLKYAHFKVIMYNSALRMIYVLKKQSKTHRIQKYLEELSDYSFTIEHSPGTKMFISDYLSRFSADNIETDSIPFLTGRKDLTGNL